MPNEKTTAKKKTTRRTREQPLESVACQIGSIAEQLEICRDYVEQMAEGISEIPMALTAVANATALSVIAQYGSAEDRVIAMGILKRWFDDFRPDA